MEKGKGGEGRRERRGERSPSTRLSGYATDEIS